MNRIAIKLGYDKILQCQKSIFQVILLNYSLAGWNQKVNSRQLSLLHDREVVCALVHTAVLPPFWATMQSLDLLCVWLSHWNTEIRFETWHITYSHPSSAGLAATAPRTPTGPGGVHGGWKNNDDVRFRKCKTNALKFCHLSQFFDRPAVVWVLTVFAVVVEGVVVVVVVRFKLKFGWTPKHQRFLIKLCP